MNETKETSIDVSLVKRLITSQFPQWAHLHIQPVESAGTDNAIYRLGDNMAVRFPRVEWAVGQTEKEYRWLPQLAQFLPLPIPTPLAMGMPAEEYPWRWSVYRWLEGENATIGQVDDHCRAAGELARFVYAMQRIEPAGGPISGPHNFGRCVPLAMRDVSVRNAIASLNSIIDTEMASAAWDAALQAPVWKGEGVWLHGDLHPGNLLVEQGRISAVIDFGALGVGDPACDMMVAWTFLSADSRRLFREALPIDDATWARGRGWALSFGLIAYAYYFDKNPVLAAISRRSIDEVLADHSNGV